MIFLYQLERGKAGGSYGLNVAALAGLPTSLLKLAQAKSTQLHSAMIGRTLVTLTDRSEFMNLMSQTGISSDS